MKPKGKCSGILNRRGRNGNRPQRVANVAKCLSSNGTAIWSPQWRCDHFHCAVPFWVCTALLEAPRTEHMQRSCEHTARYCRWLNAGRLGTKGENNWRDVGGLLTFILWLIRIMVQTKSDTSYEKPALKIFNLRSLVGSEQGCPFAMRMEKSGRSNSLLSEVQFHFIRGTGSGSWASPPGGVPPVDVVITVASAHLGTPAVWTFQDNKRHLTVFCRCRQHWYDA